MRHPDGTVHDVGVPIRQPMPGTLGMAPGPMQAVVLALRTVEADDSLWGVSVEALVVTYEDRRLLWVAVLAYSGAEEADLWVPNATQRNLRDGESVRIDPSDDPDQWELPSDLRDLDGDNVLVEFLGGKIGRPFVRGRIAHPAARRVVREPSAEVEALSHPAVAEGHVRFVEHRGTRVVLDGRGNVAIDTTAAGTKNDGGEVGGDEPRGTVYVQLREEQRLVVSVDGDERLVIQGDEVRFAGGDIPVARKDDETLSDSSTDETFWKWLEGFVAVFTGWTPVPNDGGAALSTALKAYTGQSPTPEELRGKINEGSDEVTTA